MIFEFKIRNFLNFCFNSSIFIVLNCLSFEMFFYRKNEVFFCCLDVFFGRFISKFSILLISNSSEWFSVVNQARLSPTKSNNIGWNSMLKFNYFSHFIKFASRFTLNQRTIEPRNVARFHRRDSLLI